MMREGEKSTMPRRKQGGQMPRDTCRRWEINGAASLQELALIKTDLAEMQSQIRRLVVLRKWKTVASKRRPRSFATKNEKNKGEPLSFMQL